MPGLSRLSGFRRSGVLLTVSVLLAAVVAGAMASPARAQPGDTITIGMTDLPVSLDPADVFDFNAWEVLRHLYTGLTRQIPGTLDYELALADDVRISEDRLTYTFTLRDGIAFTDGTSITAQTFVDSLARVVALRGRAAEAVTPYVADVSAPDERTLVFTLTRPIPYFLGLVALPPYFPQHPDLAAADTPQPFADGFVGNGPYLLDAFAVREQIRLVANPDYDLGLQPKTETIVLQYFARSQDLRNAIQTHAVDLAWRALLLPHLEQAAAVEGVTLVDVPSTRVFYMALGQVREPTDDPLVREAITALIEREKTAYDVFDGHIAPLTSLVPPIYREAYAPIWPDEPDYDYAESVLLVAGYRERQTSRLRLSIAFSQYVYGDPYPAGVTQMARASFSGTDFVDYGIYTEIEPDAFFDVLTEGTGSVAIYGWNPIVPHPHAYLYPIAHSSQAMPANSRYAAPEIDALLEQAALQDDPAEQGVLYRQVAELLKEDFAIIPLWQDHLQIVAWDDIGGIQIEPNYFLRYDLLVRE